MGPNNDVPNSAQKQDAKEVGLAFAQKYYKGAVRGPDGVMDLFGDNSVYVDATGKEAHGKKEIRAAIGDLNLQEGKILVVSLNSAFTGSGCIMVQVIANYLFESSKYGFSESFHLVPQNNKGWYVRCCLFKWHDQAPTEHKVDQVAPPVKEEANNVMTNGHVEAKHPPKPVDVPAREKVEEKVVEKAPPKEQELTNGTSAPPKTATPTKASPPVVETKPSAPPAAPTSWAAAIGNGGVKPPTAVNNGVKPAPVSNSASEAKLPPTLNGDTNVDGAQDKRMKKQAKAKSDFTIHVSKIVKGKKATEKDVVVDITKAFEEFGPVAHVRVPGRRLADDKETTLYAFVDFKEKDDFEKMFNDREKDEEGRVKVTINLPVLSFVGEVIIAQNHDRGGRQFFRNNRHSSDNAPRPNNGNGRPGGNYRNRRPSRNGGQQQGNRPTQTGNRNHSDNRRKENGTLKAKA